MSVNTIGPKQRWKGLSTDEKPAANPGDVFFETDTRIWKEYDGTAWVQTHSGGAAHVTTAGTPGAMDTRIFTFDATTEVDAIADRIKIDTISSTARRVQCIWHGAQNTWNGTADAGPIASGAYITVDAGDDSTADTRLTVANVTGGATSSSGIQDTAMVSVTSPYVEFILGAAVTRIDVMGIPAGQTPANIVPVRLEVRILG